MRLTIVIPALNEEDAIGSIIERCLKARETIIANSPVDDVEVVVVNDGSTDRTAEIAAGFHDIKLINFEKNRGYGAAIKRGFEVGRGELVAFLDADGTCDPTFFATLCSAMFEEHASVAIGSRMGPHSRMPPVRRLGNRFYALILAGLSNRVVSDTASGMRVIRRDALMQLYPLPDGLHFTPAMSARVLMDDRLTIVERPMSYEERIGESKLHVARDGIRFLCTILEMTLMWRPTKLFFSTAVFGLAIMVLLASHPIENWLRLGRLDEDMIYRLLFCSFLGTTSVALLASSVLSDNLHRFLDDRHRQRTFVATLLDRTFTYPGLCVTFLVASPALAWLVGPGIWSRLTAGYVTLHWSRVVLAGLIAFGLGQMLITVLITNVLRFHTDRKSAARSAHRTEHTSPATKMLNVSLDLESLPDRESLPLLDRESLLGPPAGAEKGFSAERRA